MMCYDYDSYDVQVTITDQEIKFVGVVDFHWLFVLGIGVLWYSLDLFTFM